MRKTFQALVRMNEVEQPYDGGRILLHCDDREVREAGLRQVELIINATNDEVMRDFPSTRTAMETQRFRVTVELIEDAS